MSKYFFLMILQAFFFSSVLHAQKTASDTNPAGAVADLPKMSGKTTKPTENKDDTIALSGMGGLTFVVSNIADGTYNTYKHSQRILLPLVTSVNGPKFQLVFYGENDNIPYAVALDGDVVDIYYPMVMFADIKQKLEQSLAQKKKIQLRIVQRKDGFREGAIIF